MTGAVASHRASAGFFGRRGFAAAILALCLVVAFAVDAAAQSGRERRNKAQPYYDPPRKAVVASFTAVYAWTESLLKGIERPAPLFYGNGDIRQKALAPGQEEQLAQGEALVLFGTEIDAWLEPIYREKAGANAIVIRLHAPGEPKDYDQKSSMWLDVALAKSSIEKLAAELKRLRPGKGEAIDANLAALLADIDGADKYAAGILKDFSGAKVWLRAPGLEPFLKHYNIGIAGTIVADSGQDIMPSDAGEFRKKIMAESDTQILVRTPGLLPVSLQRLAQETPLRTASIDPVESGDAKGDSYAMHIRQNALNLALQLRVRTVIAAAFTPVPDKDSVVAKSALGEPIESEEGMEEPEGK